MPRYRLITRPSGRPWPPWRETREEAVADALECGLAERDDRDPALHRWDPMAYIEESQSVSDWKLWACALQVQKQHGERVNEVVVERIGALALEGDMEGVAAWRQIAERLDALAEAAAVRH